MGMFDEFRSSYNLGEHFTETYCQTRDIEEYGISGTMTLYWLDPSGVLWKPNYIGTNEMKEISETDERYSKERGFLNFEWIPTGKHGKYKPHLITKYVRVYPGQWKGNWEEWPTLKLHFVNGVLQGFEDITGRKYD